MQQFFVHLCKKIHITIDSPVVLTTAAICIAVHLLSLVYPPLHQYFVWLPWRATFVMSPVTLMRLFTHPFVHSDWAHLHQNLMIFCLVGPPCERYYSSEVVAWVFICASVAVALSHWISGPPNAAVEGLSGFVWALIMLNAVAGIRDRALPASALLTASLWIAKEIGQWAWSKDDNISHWGHLVGATVGGYCGYVRSLNQQHYSIFAWFASLFSSKKSRGFYVDLHARTYSG